MSESTPLTTNNLANIEDGSDRLNPQDTASVSGRSARSGVDGRRQRVDSSEYRRSAGAAGHRARHSSSSGGTGGSGDLPAIRDDDVDQGDSLYAPQATSSRVTEERASPRATAQEPQRERVQPRTQPRDNRSAPAYQTPPTEGYNLDAAQVLLLEELIEINGQDSYDALAAGIGKLKKDEYLRLPNDFNTRPVHAREVGKPAAHQGMSPAIWAQVYALNKAIAPEGSDPVVFGFMRMEAVKAGWYDDQREVTFVNPVADAVRAMVTDFATVRDRLERIKTAAFVLPLVAEHVFRTMGHHFITSDSATYVSRYTDTFKSCLLPDIAGLLPPAVMYHAAMHWVSPRRARAVLIAQSGTTTIPDALQIRSNAAPAGTAILTTTAAIIDAMGSVGLAAQFEKYGGFDLGLIRRLTVTIKSDPTRYHKSYFAYGVAALDAGEATELERGKAEAIKFAPYAQAFINTLLRDAALGRAKALAKHADGNPIQMRRAANLFRAIIRKEVTDVKTLFAATITERDLE